MCLCESSVFTVLALLGAVCWPIQVYPSKVSTHVQSQTKLLPPLNGKTVIPSGCDPFPLSNPGGSKNDGRPAFWSALLTTSFIAECLGKRPALYLQDKPCKPLLSILPPQRQEWGIQTSAPTLRAMATLKLSESRSVPSDETGKALSQAPLSFCAVANNLTLDTWSATRNMFSQYLSTMGRSQAFWRLGSSGKGGPPLALLQDSTASAVESWKRALRTLSVRNVNSRKNSFHQFTHRVHKGKERRQCYIFCSPTTKITKI